MKRSGVYVALVIVLAVLALVIVRMLDKKGQDVGQATVREEARPVTVATVEQQDFAVEIDAVGTLKARETSPLSAKVAGTVNEVLVDMGDRVEKDQVVIRLDRTNYDLAVQQARAALAAARSIIPQAAAQNDQAQKEYRRAADLLKEKVIPQSRFDAAEAAYKTARESVSSAAAQRDQAKAALNAALEHLNDAEIKAPIAGTVVQRNVEVGQAVSPGLPLLRIVDQQSMKIDLNLPETDIGRLSGETGAVLTADAYPGLEFPAQVAVINPMVDPATRTFSLRIEVPNDSGKLMDGMFARVRLSLDRKTSLAIPRNALQSLPGSAAYYVYVVDQGKAAKIPVEVGATNKRFVEITGGLSEGQTVVTSGAGRLRTGVEVKITDSPGEGGGDSSAGTSS